MLNKWMIAITFTAFFTGYCLSPILYKNNVKPLLVYPLWITKKLKKFISQKIKIYIVFAMILSINSMTLLIIAVAGNLPVLPAILILWLGINLGVAVYHISGKKQFYLILINPVAILEIIATIITGSYSLEFSMEFSILKSGNIFGNLLINKIYLNSELSITFLFKIFLHYSFPLLILAAILETVMIMIASKKDEQSPTKI